MQIREGYAADLDAIVEILNQAIRAGVNGYTRETTPVERRPWFDGHTATHPLVVVEEDGAVIGWGELSPYRPGRDAFRRTAEITYYVHEAHRREGVGSALVEHLIGTCAESGLRTLVAILLESNAPSIGLLERHGFERWAHLPGVAELDGREVGHVYYGRKATARGS